ncbi:MAG: hypothetical protein AAGL68_08030 [Pseudomonadota bacterium]
MAQKYMTVQNVYAQTRDRLLISTPPYNLPATDLVRDDACHALVNALSSGGDARISLTGENGLNKYFSAPYPRDVIAYSSSTVSDISAAAFQHLLALEAKGQSGSYAERLGRLRERISAAYDMTHAASIVFAASGTDLEYVALACVRDHAEGGIHNILLGADEIGSGCIHSAHGRYFANETALGLDATPATDVAGCGPVSIVDVPVRCGEGGAYSSAEITGSIAREIDIAKMASKHALVHVVHGSKTGLVLPELADLDALRERFDADATFVVDACQARITSTAIADYLARDCIVLLTGSKFMGAPPFNGFALIPDRLASAAAPLPAGFNRIFNRAEFPDDWPGAGALDNGENFSLALRLEAAIFELERFQQIALLQVEAMIAAFEHTLLEQVIEPLGVKRVVPNFAKGPEAEHDRPIEMRTLATLDVSMLPGARTFDEAQALHRELAFDGIRLGQPVKCVRRDGGWGGTLRIGLSMPMMNVWAQMRANDVEAKLASDLGAIAEKLRSKTREHA